MKCLEKWKKHLLVPNRQKWTFKMSKQVWVIQLQRIWKFTRCEVRYLGSTISLFKQEGLDFWARALDIPAMTHLSKEPLYWGDTVTQSLLPPLSNHDLGPWNPLLKGPSLLLTLSSLRVSFVFLLLGLRNEKRG